MNKPFIVLFGALIFALAPAASAVALEGFYKGDAYGVTTYTNEDGHQKISLTAIVSCVMFGADSSAEITYYGNESIEASYQPSSAAGQFTFDNPERVEALEFLVGQKFDETLEDLGISADTLAQAVPSQTDDGNSWVNAFFPSMDGTRMIGVVFLREDGLLKPSQYMILTRVDSCE